MSNEKAYEDIAAAQEAALRPTQSQYANAQQKLADEPTEDQRDLSATYGTLLAALIAYNIAEPAKREALLLGSIEAVVERLDQRIEFRPSDRAIHVAATYLLTGAPGLLKR